MFEVLGFSSFHKLPTNSSYDKIKYSFTNTVMLKHSFDFGSTILVITSPKQIKEEILDEIYKLLQFVKYDFNHKIHNSSAYRFNDVDPTIPCPLSKEFLYYLKMNIGLTDKTNKAFQPFSSKDGEITNTMSEVIYLDKYDVVKTEKIIFDTEVLIQPFVVDTIFDKLKEERFHNFLISTNNYHRCDEVAEWTVELEIENNQMYKSAIRNECVGLNFNHKYREPKIPRMKFASQDRMINFKFAILKTKTCIENKVLGMELRELVMESDFKNFSHNNKQPFILIDVNDTEIFFEPIRLRGK